MRPASQPVHERVSVEPFAGNRLLGHRPILESRRIAWSDEAACAAWAAALAAPARRSALAEATLALSGPLGAGKTTFVRHLLRELGVAGRIKSPTYAVLESYALPRLAVSHFDFYRFADPAEFDAAGLREPFAAPGLKLVEWPEHAGESLPRPDLWLEIAPDADGVRQVRADALTPRGRELLP